MEKWETIFEYDGSINNSMPQSHLGFTSNDCEYSQWQDGDIVSLFIDGNRIGGDANVFGYYNSFSINMPRDFSMPPVNDTWSAYWSSPSNLSIFFDANFIQGIGIDKVISHKIELKKKIS